MDSIYILLEIQYNDDECRFKEIFRGVSTSVQALVKKAKHYAKTTYGAAPDKIFLPGECPGKGGLSETELQYKIIEEKLLK
jgi:hypothetical protein